MDLMTSITKTPLLPPGGKKLQPTASLRGVNHVSIKRVRVRVCVVNTTSKLFVFF